MCKPVSGIVAALCMLTIACAKPAAEPAGTTARATPARADAPGKTLAEWFQGRAGVEVQQVGGGVRIRIRGAGEWDGRSDPLFVLDGVMLNPPGGVFSMNPSEIATLEILKDDASSAVYGIRGANGVVKITTKRKKDGHDNA